MIEVKGDRVLVEAEVVKDRTESGLYLEYESKKREQASITIGKVVGIGSNCWEGYQVRDWCQVGDKIVYAPFAGGYITDPSDEKRYVIINDRDVLAVIKESDTNE